MAAVLGIAAGITVASPAQADGAPVNPDDPKTPTTVTADGLPTVQIDGVVWSQVVVGNTVYAGGSFKTARPAGAALGVQTTPRANMLSYDIRIGELMGFDHVFNAQVRALTKSPDGKRVYAVGDFTQVDSQWRVHAAAFDTATGALIAGFAPTLSANPTSNESR